MGGWSVSSKREMAERSSCPSNSLLLLSEPNVKYKLLDSMESPHFTINSTSSESKFKEFCQLALIRPKSV